MLARQRTSGHGERCTALRMVPAENPRIAPNIINFFILPRTPKRCLAEGLPAPKTAENGLFSPKLAGQEGFSGRRKQITRNILPAREIANVVICAEDQVPNLAPTRFFVQVGQDQIADSNVCEKTGLIDQVSGFIRTVENEMNFGRRPFSSPRATPGISMKTFSSRRSKFCGSVR
jgi:hypothetical protein